MTEGLSKSLVPPSKRTTNFFYKGLVLFYPESVFGTKEGSKRPVQNYWSETGYKRTEFAELLWNITKTEDTDQAAKIILEWKRLWDENKYPEATVPENLDEMLSSLEESATGEKKLSPYNTQTLAKKTLLESQKLIEKVAPTSAPEPEYTTSSPETLPKAVDSLSAFAGKILAAPFRTATYISGPATYSSSAKGEGPGVATARYMLTHGITSTSIQSLENKAQQLGITPNQLRNLASLIKTEQDTHPFSYKWVSIIYSGQKASLSQSQISSLLIPSSDGSTAILPRKSFIGGVLGRIGQQVFGKLASKTLKAVGKKVAAKITTTAATQAAATAIAPGIANIVVLAGQAIIGKIKDFISSLKSKEGREKVLTLLFGSMIIGGILLGGPLGAALVVGGLVPGFGLLATKAGGLGPLGTSVGSYGQAFMTGLTGVVFPSIAAPLIISFISIPVAIAVILFIINSGAYIVPPKTPEFTGIIESPYIGVEKTATPDCLNKKEKDKVCPNLPGTVTYNIEIKAKKGTLTNVQFENKYQVLGEGNESDLPEKPNLDIPQIISPVEPYIFNYSLPFGNGLDDSIVLDTLTVTADAPEQSGAMASDVASVIIGNPPASSCPILGGSISTGTYNGTNETGHGGNNYWGGPAGSSCYAIPAFSGCRSPSDAVDPDKNNFCRGTAQACSHYGYAVDSPSSGGSPVFLPSIFGETLNWTFKRRVTINNTNWGWGYLFTAGKYQLYLGHLNQTTPPSTAPSGTVIGTLYPGLSNPHVHIELQINGQWVIPDFLCGGRGP